MNSATPNNQDLFSRFMVSAFDEKKIIGVPTAFQSFFGRPETGSETVFSSDSATVDIDIIRGNERLAALIPRGSVGRSMGSAQKNLRSEQMSSFSRKYPLVEEEGDISSDILTNRIAGENPYSKVTRMDRLRSHALKIHHESVRRTVRLNEYLAGQSLLTGKQPTILGTANTDLIYDFRRNATHTVTVGTAWAGGAADILGDIDAMCNKIRANGHVMPDGCLLGATAMKSLLSDATVKAMADNRRFELIQFGQGKGDDMFQMGYGTKFAHLIAGGFIPRGIIKTPAGFELVLFTYVDVYTASNGTATKYVPDLTCFIFSSSARADRYFGPPENLPMIPMREALYRDYFGFDPSAPPMPPNIKSASGVIVPASFYCDSYVSQDWKRLTIRTQTAPIFATTQTDAFGTITTG